MIDTSKLERLIGSAVLAPSSHNSQPWLFQVRENGIRLFADRTRALPVNDPYDRELLISCGCALQNLRVAAAHEGLGTHVVTFPDPNDGDLLAEVTWIVGPDDRLAILADAIPRRRTYRKRFLDRPVSDEMLDTLRRMAEEEGALFVPLSGAETRNSVVRLVTEGDAVLWSNPSWRRELAQWMHPRRNGDGLSLPWLAVPIAQIVVRSFDMGGGIGAKDAELTEASPVLGVLCTWKDDKRDRLAAGLALERLLLSAVTDGLQASYLNQPIEVPSLRSRLADLAGVKGFPQILLRVGYPEEDLPAAPRRAVADVILE